MPSSSSISAGFPFRVHLGNPCPSALTLVVRLRFRNPPVISNSFLELVALLRRLSLPVYCPFSPAPLSLPLSLIPFPYLRISFRPSPDRVPSCGGPGLSAPVIPPSRAGFPLRPRPLEGPGVSSPRLTVPRPRVARAPCSRVAGVIVPASGASGRRGRVPSNPHGSRGWYGARGLTPSPYSVGCPWGAIGG